jgi:hypothetical protein
METERKCRDRVVPALHGRMTDIIPLWDDYKRGETEAEIKGFLDYGLCIDYVAPGTFEHQREGYWRWQISWGGPSDEFRFFSSGPDYRPYRIEYWFMDWGDGAMVFPGPDYEPILEEIWDWMADTGIASAEYKKALES